MAEYTEQQVRQLRDNIYGRSEKTGTDGNWEACKANWLTPENIQWLIDHQP